MPYNCDPGSILAARARHKPRFAPGWRVQVPSEFRGLAWAHSGPQAITSHTAAWATTPHETCSDVITGERE
jgi:hypothetical protein